MSFDKFYGPQCQLDSHSEGDSKSFSSFTNSSTTNTEYNINDNNVNDDFDHEWTYNNPYFFVTKVSEVQFLIDEFVTTKFSDKVELHLSDLVNASRSFPQIGHLIWSTPSAVRNITFEIVSVYHVLLDKDKFNSFFTSRTERVCQAIYLFKMIALHPQVQKQFFEGNFVSFLLPILRIRGLSSLSGYKKIISFAVNAIGSIFRAIIAESEEHTNIFYELEIVSHLLYIAENFEGTVKYTSICLLNSIIQTKFGLNFICLSFKQFSELAKVLGNLTIRESNCKNPNEKVLKYIIRIYLRLCDDDRALKALRICLPVVYVHEPLIYNLFKKDTLTLHWYTLLKQTVPDQPIIIR